MKIRVSGKLLYFPYVMAQQQLDLLGERVDQPWSRAEVFLSIDPRAMHADVVPDILGALNSSRSTASCITASGHTSVNLHVALLHCTTSDCPGRTPQCIPAKILI